MPKKSTFFLQRKCTISLIMFATVLISEFVYVSSVLDKRRLLSRPYKKSAFCLFLDCAFVNRSMNGFDSNFMVS